MLCESVQITNSTAVQPGWIYLRKSRQFCPPKEAMSIGIKDDDKVYFEVNEITLNMQKCSSLKPEDKFWTKAAKDMSATDSYLIFFCSVCKEKKVDAEKDVNYEYALSVTYAYGIPLMIIFDKNVNLDSQEIQQMLQSSWNGEAVSISAEVKHIIIYYEYRRTAVFNSPLSAFEEVANHLRHICRINDFISIRAVVNTLPDHINCSEQMFEQPGLTDNFSYGVLSSPFRLLMKMFGKEDVAIGKKHVQRMIQKFIKYTDKRICAASVYKSDFNNYWINGELSYACDQKCFERKYTTYSTSNHSECPDNKQTEMTEIPKTDPQSEIPQNISDLKVPIPVESHLNTTVRASFQLETPDRSLALSMMPEETELHSMMPDSHSSVVKTHVKAGFSSKTDSNVPESEKAVVRENTEVHRVQTQVQLNNGEKLSDTDSRHLGDVKNVTVSNNYKSKNVPGNVSSSSGGPGTNISLSSEQSVPPTKTARTSKAAHKEKIDCLQEPQIVPGKASAVGATKSTILSNSDQSVPPTKTLRTSKRVAQKEKKDHLQEPQHVPGTTGTVDGTGSKILGNSDQSALPKKTLRISKAFVHKENIVRLQELKHVERKEHFEHKYYGSCEIHNEKERKYLLLFGSDDQSKSTILNLVWKWCCQSKVGTKDLPIVDAKNKIKDITYYHISCADASFVDMTIISTPELNKATSDSIKEFMRNKGDIHALGFAVAHPLHLRTVETDLFSFVRSLYGEVSYNHCMMFVTFCDVLNSFDIKDKLKNSGIKAKHIFELKNAETDFGSDSDYLKNALVSFDLKKIEKMARVLQKLTPLSPKLLKVAQEASLATTHYETSLKGLQNELANFISLQHPLPDSQNRIMKIWKLVKLVFAMTGDQSSEAALVQFLAHILSTLYSSLRRKESPARVFLSLLLSNPERNVTVSLMVVIRWNYELFSDIYFNICKEDTTLAVALLKGNEVTVFCTVCKDVHRFQKRTEQNKLDLALKCQNCKCSGELHVLWTIHDWLAHSYNFLLLASDALAEILETDIPKIPFIVDFNLLMDVLLGVVPEYRVFLTAVSNARSMALA